MSFLTRLSLQSHARLHVAVRSCCTQIAAPHNYYKLLGIQEKFSIDVDMLASRFKDLQRQWHPDKFGNASASEKEKAAAMSAHLNEAYATLRVPDRRAKHLLQLITHDPTPPQLDPTFLSWVMETREKISSAITRQDSASLKAIERETQEGISACLAAIAQAFETRNMERASLETAKLQYLRRIHSAATNDF